MYEFVRPNMVLHARRFELSATFVPSETRNFMLQRCVHFLKIGHTLAKLGNFNNQLFDKLAKFVVRELFGCGRQHKKYASHPALDVNRETILIRPASGCRNGPVPHPGVVGEAAVLQSDGVSGVR